MQQEASEHFEKHLDIFQQKAEEMFVTSLVGCNEFTSPLKANAFSGKYYKTKPFRLH